MSRIAIWTAGMSCGTESQGACTGPRCAAAIVVVLRARFAALAKELGVVLPISYYERANNAYYNSLAVADADGTIVGRYRKSHIPDGPGCALAVIVNPIDCGGCCRAHRQGTRSHGINGL